MRASRFMQHRSIWLLKGSSKGRESLTGKGKRGRYSATNIVPYLTKVSCDLGEPQGTFSIEQFRLNALFRDLRSVPPIGPS